MNKKFWYILVMIIITFGFLSFTWQECEAEDEYKFERMWPEKPWHFNSSRAIAADTSGNVYVADGGNYCIQKFTSDGTFITKWGIYGRGDGEFYWLHGIAVDTSGNVYVADAGNNRIQKFVPSTVYYIKGYIKNTTGVGIEGVDVHLSVVGSGTYTTNSAGYYEFSNLILGSNYMVTPYKSGYSFSPSSRVYTPLSSNQDNQSFIGVRGRVDAGEIKIVGGKRGYINPDQGEKVYILLKPGNSGSVKINIYDLTGSLIWNISKELTVNNEETIEWDGKNSNGRNVASGIYIIYAEGCGINKAKKVAVVK